jgi:hypothetical protein
MSTDQQHFDASRQFQAYYDETLRKVGTHAPAPVLGQSVNDYRRETLRQLKRTFLPPAHDLYQVQYRSLRSDALQALEPQLLKAVETEANNPAHVPPGELRKIERLDEYGKVKCVEFVGQESFVKQMTRPGRRVVRFLSPSDSYGRSVRELA